MFYSYNNLGYICCLLIQLLTNSLIKMKQKKQLHDSVKEKRLAQACLWGQQQIGDTKFSSILPQNLEKGKRTWKFWTENALLKDLLNKQCVSCMEVSLV